MPLVPIHSTQDAAQLMQNDTELDLTCHDIGDTEAKHLFETLKRNTTLQVLVLIDNQVGDVQYLAEALRENSTLRKLYLKGNSIDANGAKHLFEALRKNEALEYLDLVDNHIGDTGAEYLVEPMKHNNTLRILRLDGNEIGDTGAQHLASILKCNSTLQELWLAENSFGDTGAQYLIDALDQNTTLLRLPLNTKLINLQLWSKIHRLLKRNKKNPHGTRSTGDSNPSAGRSMHSDSITSSDSMTVSTSGIVTLSDSVSASDIHPSSHFSVSQQGSLQELKVSYENPLGFGGLGIVHRCVHKDSSKDLALKLLKIENVDREELKRDFIKEWQVLHSLVHPNIVKVFHRIDDGEKIGYTMELMQKSLDKHMRDLSTHDAVYIALEIAKGLVYLHDKNLAHNDLKPGNVLLREVSDTGRLEVKISDFGAVSTRDRVARITSHNQMTLAYAPPERLERGEYSLSADVYSFGVMLNQMLSGEAPFQDLDRKGIGRHCKAVVRGQRPQIPTKIPHELRKLIEESWSTDPEKRPRMDQVRTRLEDIRENLPQEG